MTGNIDELIQKIDEGACDEALLEMYVDKGIVADQKSRYIGALKRFEELYGDEVVEIYSAPGRSEIGGNHTDHQYGIVLAASVNIDAIAVVSKRPDNIVCLKSEGYSSFTLDLSDLNVNKKEEGTTAALVRGVASGVAKKGYHIGGFNAYVTSQVLGGSGLSSSAAIETLIGNIFSGLFNEETIDAIQIAQIGQVAENDYFGKPSGLMDQMACSVGGLIKIDFRDLDNPLVCPVKVDFRDFKHSLCIVDTKGSHADLTAEYADIPEEMKKVAAYFGKDVLRQVNEENFYRELTLIRKYTGDRAVLRAIHWFDENKRVDDQVKSLECHDFESFKMLIRKSGDSSYKLLQNVYAPRKCEEQSIALALLLSERILGDKACCRVHGGGFAGTIQAFVPDPKVDEYRREIEAFFGKGACHVLKVRPCGGRRVL